MEALSRLGAQAALGDEPAQDQRRLEVLAPALLGALQRRQRGRPARARRRARRPGTTLPVREVDVTHARDPLLEDQAGLDERLQLRALVRGVIADVAGELEAVAVRVAQRARVLGRRRRARPRPRPARGRPRTRGTRRSARPTGAGAGRRSRRPARSRPTCRRSRRPRRRAGRRSASPTTLSGRSVISPISVIESSAVVVARIACPGVAASSSANTRCLTSMRSGMASTTRSTSPNPRSRSRAMRPTTAPGPRPPLGELALGDELGRPSRSARGPGRPRVDERRGRPQQRDAGGRDRLGDFDARGARADDRRLKTNMRETLALPIGGELVGEARSERPSEPRNWRRSHHLRAGARRSFGFKVEARP